MPNVSRSFNVASRSHHGRIPPAEKYQPGERGWLGALPPQEPGAVCQQFLKLSLDEVVKPGSTDGSRSRAAGAVVLS